MGIIAIAAATIIGVIVATLIDRKRGTRKVASTVYSVGKFGRRTLVLVIGAASMAFFVFVGVISIHTNYDDGTEREDVDGTLWYCKYVEETRNADWLWLGVTYTNTERKVIDDCTVISGPTNETEK